VSLLVPNPSGTPQNFNLTRFHREETRRASTFLPTSIDIADRFSRIQNLVADASKIHYFNAHKSSSNSSRAIANRQNGNSGKVML
jgi:hypothetical protein